MYKAADSEPVRTLPDAAAGKDRSGPLRAQQCAISVVQTCNDNVEGLLRLLGLPSGWQRRCMQPPARRGWRAELKVQRRGKRAGNAEDMCSWALGGSGRQRGLECGLAPAYQGLALRASRSLGHATEHSSDARIAHWTGTASAAEGAESAAKRGVAEFQLSSTAICEYMRCAQSNLSQACEIRRRGRASSHLPGCERFKRPAATRRCRDLQDKEANLFGAMEARLLTGSTAAGPPSRDVEFESWSQPPRAHWRLAPAQNTNQATNSPFLDGLQHSSLDARRLALALCAAHMRLVPRGIKGLLSPNRIRQAAEEQPVESRNAERRPAWRGLSTCSISIDHPRRHHTDQVPWDCLDCADQ